MNLSEDQSRGFVRGSWWRNEGKAECAKILDERPDASTEEISVELCQKHLPQVDWDQDDLPQGVMAVLNRMQDYIGDLRNEIDPEADGNDEAHEVDANEAPLIASGPLRTKASCEDDDSGGTDEDRATMSSDEGTSPKRRRRGSRGKGKNKAEAAQAEAAEAESGDADTDTDTDGAGDGNSGNGTTVPSGDGVEEQSA